jgi:UDP-N-acetylmuramoyl-L-alanyl-D-glutamate--2,6-diaminopimelate ligase
MTVLSEIIDGAGVISFSGNKDIRINGLQSDSRNVSAGDLFIAVRGTRADGHAFIGKAIEKGATAIVCEELPAGLCEGITYLRVRNSSEALGVIASHYYGNPSEKLRLVGITGTNGKTTTATLLYRLFSDSGSGTGLISTIVNRINDKEIAATHTTPDPISLNALLARMVAEGCTFCFMEVSSHAADQRRIAGLSFTGGIFTNLTHDHLDYHKTFDQYLKAKKSFFDGLPESAFALVNKDDRNGSVMVQNTKARRYTYSLKGMADFHGRILENQFSGLQLWVDGTEVWFNLVGAFNAFNLLAVYAAALLLGMDRTAVLTSLSGMSPVEGRFNTIRSTAGVTAIVDYAHTPDALQNVLSTIDAIRGHHEQLITVVGAGGNRDAAKRPLMARIACEYSNRVILTSDNPRFEEPEAILEEMKQGIEPGQTKKALTIIDRREAIRTACSFARQGDIILIAGKGHESYQEIKGVRHPFDDRKVVMEMFNDIITEKP